MSEIDVKNEGPAFSVHNLVAVDVETGGFFAGRSCLLQIGAATASGARFEQKILPVPGMEMDRDALRVNGYDAEVWKKEGVELVTAVRNFRDWLVQQKKKTGAWVPMGHNVSFDRGFLDWAQERVKVRLPLCYRYECSMSLMASLMRLGLIPSGSCSLDALCRLARLERPPVHDAMADAVAALQGYVWLNQRILEASEKKEVAA